LNKGSAEARRSFSSGGKTSHSGSIRFIAIFVL
jgi:hypothetical protein